MADFDPAEFHNLAVALLSTLSGAQVAASGPDQAKVRTAIGRAYYAAFLAARQTLSASGEITPSRTHEDHKLVLDVLGGESSDLGKRMHYLRRKRNQADYNLNPSGFTHQAARHWLRIASDLIIAVGSRR